MITVRAEGADTLARTLRDAADDLDDLTPAHRSIGGDVVRVSRGLAPVRTGRLRASIATTAASGTGLTVTAGAPYAGFVHTRNPFLTGALDRTADRAADTVQTAVEQALDTIRGA